jgi:hypothetical protein
MINVIEPGKKFQITDSAGNQLDIVFCHKDKDGAFVHGITTEDLMDVLVSRARHFTIDKGRDTQENLNELTHLKQAQQWGRQRNHKKKVERDKYVKR